MTYEDIRGILFSNHFLSTGFITKGKEITGIHVNGGSPLLIQERCARIREVLKEAACDCTVEYLSNDQYILVRKNDTLKEK